MARANLVGNTSYTRSQEEDIDGNSKRDSLSCLPSSKSIHHVSKGQQYCLLSSLKSTASGYMVLLQGRHRRWRIQQRSEPCMIFEYGIAQEGPQRPWQQCYETCQDWCKADYCLWHRILLDIKAAFPSIAKTISSSSCCFSARLVSNHEFHSYDR